ncbi:histone H1 [Oceaniovalibus sp. ACAM 378]|nr:histone H1 [Oceaniovalibus sp. ACAM 378]
MIVGIATGEVNEVKKRRNAVSTGSKGGQTRAANLSKQERVEIAKKAAATRWGKKALPDEEESS